MMRKVFLAALLAATTLIATSCAVYNGTSTDIPLFQEKGELQVEVSNIAPLIFIPTGANVAYSLTDHVGISAGGDWMRRHWQVMAGTYNPVGKHFVWELYGGFTQGMGEVTEKNEGYAPVSGHWWMPYMQVDCGWRELTSRLHLDVAFSLRAGGLYCNSTFYRWDDMMQHHIPVQAASGMRLLLEPSMEVRFGWNHFKFNTQLSFSTIIGDQIASDNFRLIPYTPIFLSFGMSYRFKIGH